jgi:hypothetical protein
MAVKQKQLGVVAALATLPVVAPAPAQAATGPQQCVTRTLTAEQVARGERSRVTCYDAGGPALRSLQADDVLARHYTGPNGTGSVLTVTGSCGGSLQLSGSWNDVTSSTNHGICGRIKHFVDVNGGGANQITTGGLVNMNSTLNDQVSSIYYYTS